MTAKRLALCCLIIMLCSWAVTATAQTDSMPAWQAADAIRTAGVEAQRELFAARRAADPAESRNAAAAQIEDAQAIFAADIAPGLDANSVARIDATFADALTAAQNGNDNALAASRGRLWTALLDSAYQASVAAVAEGDTRAAADWLRLREYRQPTRVSIILSPASDAVAAFRSGDIIAETAAAEIHNDLRDTYFFRLREALSELESAVEKEYPTRAAEWAGQAGGYFDILRADFASKLGDDAAQSVSDALAALEADAVSGDISTFAGTLADIRDSLRDYQPVILSPRAIAEKAQLLYVFLDLIPMEYRNGVRAGAISNAIEYGEAITFRDQAEITLDELRPVIAAEHPDAVAQIETLLDDSEAVMLAFGDPSLVTEHLTAAKVLVEANLPVDPNATTTATFGIIDTLLNDMEQAAADGRFTDAEQTRLQAYALYDFDAEKLLLAFAPDLAARIEGMFWHGYDGKPGLAEAIAQKAEPQSLHTLRAELDGMLTDARVLLGEGSSEPITIITNAAIIVFREGLEAVVIIAALTASMIGANIRYRRPLFAGAVLALVATGLTWLVADIVLELFRSYGESLEAVVSLIAIGVLLLITNWFFHKLYWKDHLAGMHQKKSRLIRGREIGQVLGLVLLGFTSIYREGFETVLFLQALVLDSGIVTVIEGVALGMAGVALVGFITFRLQTRLPYMKMMVVTGILIGAVLLIMVGNTIHVMQVVGWVPITPIRGISFPFWAGQWFGVFPTWQGIIGQIAAAGFVIGSYFYVEYRNSRKRAARRTVETIQPALKTVE